ncbi:MAG: AMP-binding protein, partial [Pseudomonadales bacterium]
MNQALPSYTSGTSETPLLGMTIGEMLDNTVAMFPDTEALVVLHQDIRWTYSDLQQRVNEASRALLAIGLERGDRVGIWSPNRYEWTVTQFATAKVGAVLVNINPAYGVRELEYALNLSGVRFLVTADRFKTSDYRNMLYELAPELKNRQSDRLQPRRLPNLEGVINLDKQSHEGMWTWDEFINLAREVTDEQLHERQSVLQFDDPINIQFTSGTTGNPKGATLTHHNILNNGYFVGQSQRLNQHDRMVIPVPLYHCFGMVMGNLGCITHGATMIYPDEGFEPKSVLRAVHQERATVLYGVPTMFIAELAEPDFETYDLSSLRTGIMAGSICPAEVMKKVNGKMNMKEVQIAYGMTETSPVSTQTSSLDPFEKQVTTVGRTQPHLETKIIDPDNGNIIPRGEVGELCTRGYSVMLRY